MYLSLKTTKLSFVQIARRVGRISWKNVVVGENALTGDSASVAHANRKAQACRLNGTKVLVDRAHPA